MDAATGNGERIAVLVIDVQGDFTQFRNGSLAVPDTGKDYIDDLEAATRRLKDEGFLIIGTQDWHPGNHISFHTAHPGKKAGDVVQHDGEPRMLWPPHCMQDTENVRCCRR